MKEKIKFLILGILIGVVLTASILLLLKGKNQKFNKMPMMNGENLQFEESKMPPDFDGKRMRNSKRDNSNDRFESNNEDKPIESSSPEKSESTNANAGE